MCANVKAMVFAAGLGTRLYPLTQDRPKALVEINGVSLLEHVVRRIADAGIRDIVVNVHHFSAMMKQAVNSLAIDANISVSDETDFLLDTAGGLKFAEPLLSDADHILLHNVDILSDIDLSQLVRDHLTTSSIATLAIRERKTSRYLLFEEESLLLCGWRNVVSGETRIVRPMKQEKSYAFSGIHVVRREILDYIPSGQKMSLTPLYLDLATEHTIQGWLHQQGEWMDVGKYDELVKKGLVSPR